MAARIDGIGWELGGLLLAFAQRPRNWLVLARNLVPVVGVFALGWSSRFTLLIYWIDGMCLLALLIAADAAHRRWNCSRCEASRWSSSPGGRAAC
jgi:hypothetical protein